jgi:hypothetical protein
MTSKAPFGEDGRKPEDLIQSEVRVSLNSGLNEKMDPKNVLPITPSPDI